MKDLFVVTHTESLHHLESKVGGWYDTGLTPRGLRDAEATAERLMGMIGHTKVEIHSSDLRRAAETAAAIGDRFSRPVSETTELREISYGVAEGRPEEWLAARYTPAPDENRLDHDCGIEGAETRRDVAVRIFRYVDVIVERSCPTQIVVTHGFALAIVIAAWMKVPIDGAGFLGFPAAKGSITHLHQDDFFRNRSVVMLADTSHLDS